MVCSSFFHGVYHRIYVASEFVDTEGSLQVSCGQDKTTCFEGRLAMPPTTKCLLLAPFFERLEVSSISMLLRSSSQIESSFFLLTSETAQYFLCSIQLSNYLNFLQTNQWPVFHWESDFSNWFENKKLCKTVYTEMCLMSIQQTWKTSVKT